MLFLIGPVIIIFILLGMSHSLYLDQVVSLSMSSRAMKDGMNP